MIDATERAFDQHADHYADQWGADPVACRMRAEVHRALRAFLAPNSRVLDLGCGIGLDSDWLRRQGHDVLAVDRSAQMLVQARKRVPELETIHGSLEQVLDELEGPPFDAALLDFGVINCLDIERIAEGLRRRIRPGGMVALIPMPRIAPAWILGALKHGRWAAALERTRAHARVQVEGSDVPVRYLRASEIVTAFSPGFSLVDQQGMGLILPPPGSRRADSWSSRLASMDRRVGRLPGFRRMGDHLLMLFRRELPAPEKRGPVEKLHRRIETRHARSTGRIEVLRTLILELTGACQSQCLGCSHRGLAGGEALDLDRIQGLISEAEAMGASELLLTGGEPLLRPDIDEILEQCRRSPLRVILLSNGLALGRFAETVARCCDELVLSLDAADPGLYRDIRGVDGLGALENGVQRVRELAPDLPIRGRCTVSALNADSLREIALHARAMGMAGLSFLAADHQSPDAFGRTGAVELEVPDPEILESRLGALWKDPGPPFITNSWESLDRIIRKARADRGGPGLQHPRCDAPWTSVVVQSDLSVRPCFFLEQNGDVRMGLRAGLEQGRAHRRSLRLSQESACARCVCWARLA